MAFNSKASEPNTPQANLAVQWCQAHSSDSRVGTVLLNKSLK